MTWTKLGVEYADQCADIDLSDAAFRTHTEAIAHLYKSGRHDCTFSKSSVRRFATSEKASESIQELIDHGFWADRGARYEVVHHGDVIRDSLDAQQLKKDRDRAAQQRAREKKSKASESGEPPQIVSADVSADTRQTDRQTDKQLEGDQMTTCLHHYKAGLTPDPWKREAGCTDCPPVRRSA